MIAPQEWYEYQKQYQKYGIDMQPQSDRVPLRERRKQKRHLLHADAHVVSIESDHKLTWMLVAISVLVLIMIVFSAAYSSDLTYDISKTKAENDVISGEIEDLDVKILSAGTITYIEGQAKSKLGMKNADSKHCVFVSDSDAPEEGFADILKEKAFE